MLLNPKLEVNVSKATSKKGQQKETEGAQSQMDGKSNGEATPRIASTEDLKNFLISLLERMNANGDASPIYVLSAMNHVLSLPDIYNFLDDENKEIARALWLKMKQAGVQLRNPPILFPESEGLSK